MLRVLPRAVDAGLDVLRGGIEARVPRGETGRLRDGIDTQRAEALDEVYVEGAVTVSADYVASVEFGDRDQPARPFIRPTADADGDRAAKTVEREIIRGLR